MEIASGDAREQLPILWLTLFPERHIIRCNMPHDSHFQNLIAILEDEIRHRADELGITAEKAFSRIAAEWLGYDLDPGKFIDQKDRGIDFWSQTDSGFNIFQVKSHDFKSSSIQTDKLFSHEGILDLLRIEKYLMAPSTAEKNPGLKHFRHQMGACLRKQALRTIWGLSGGKPGAYIVGRWPHSGCIGGVEVFRGVF